MSNVGLLFLLCVAADQLAFDWRHDWLLCSFVSGGAFFHSRLLAGMLLPPLPPLERKIVGSGNGGRIIRRSHHDVIGNGALVLHDNVVVLRRRIR